MRIITLPKCWLSRLAPPIFLVHACLPHRSILAGAGWLEQEQTPSRSAAPGFSPLLGMPLPACDESSLQQPAEGPEAMAATADSFMQRTAHDTVLQQAGGTAAAGQVPADVSVLTQLEAPAHPSGIEHVTPEAQQLPTMPADKADDSSIHVAVPLPAEGSADAEDEAMEAQLSHQSNESYAEADDSALSHGIVASQVCMLLVERSL